MGISLNQSHPHDYNEGYYNPYRPPSVMEVEEIIICSLESGVRENTLRALHYLGYDIPEQPRDVKELVRLSNKLSRTKPKKGGEPIKATQSSWKAGYWLKTFREEPEPIPCCPDCGGEGKKRGFDRRGAQRYQCKSCTKWFGGLTKEQVCALI